MLRFLRFAQEPRKDLARLSDFVNFRQAQNQTARLFKRSTRRPIDNRQNWSEVKSIEMSTDPEARSTKFPIDTCLQASTDELHPQRTWQRLFSQSVGRYICKRFTSSTPIQASGALA